MNTNSYPVGKRPSEQLMINMKIIKGLEGVIGGKSKIEEPPPPPPPKNGN